MNSTLRQFTGNDGTLGLRMIDQYDNGGGGDGGIILPTIYPTTTNGSGGGVVVLNIPGQNPIPWPPVTTSPPHPIENDEVPTTTPANIPARPANFSCLWGTPYFDAAAGGWRCPSDVITQPPVTVTPVIVSGQGQPTTTATIPVGGVSADAESPTVNIGGVEINRNLLVGGIVLAAAYFLFKGDK